MLLTPIGKIDLFSSRWKVKISCKSSLILLNAIWSLVLCFDVLTECSIVLWFSFRFLQWIWSTWTDKNWNFRETGLWSLGKLHTTGQCHFREYKCMERKVGPCKCRDLANSNSSYLTAGVGLGLRIVRGMNFCLLQLRLKTAGCLRETKILSSWWYFLVGVGG